MPEQQQSEALSPAPIRAAGTRRITLTMRAEIDKADAFTGFPRGMAKPFDLLFAFKEAEPYLGLPAYGYKLIDWLVRQTKPQDWEEGSRPIAWPSARRQAEFLGLTVRGTQKLNRQLWEAGLFVMRDHPQGKRYGRRDAKGRIIEAYGFDLSPLAQRHDEFVKISAAAQVERNQMKKLRQRCSLAHRGIKQAAEELRRQGHGSEALDCLLREGDELIAAAHACTGSGELALAAQALESRKATAEQMLRELLKPVESSPQGEQAFAHNTPTNPPPNHKNDTVIASEACSPPEAPPLNPTPFQEERPSKPASQDEQPFPERLNVTPATLEELAPRLTPYMPARHADKSWPALIEAARYLTVDLGISLTLWHRACQIMGEEYAAIAVAIVSTKPPEHFTKSAGGYFDGMVKKFKRGELHLGPTLRQLKAQTWGKDGLKERHAEEAAQRRRMTIRSRAFPAPRYLGPPTAQATPPASPMLPAPASTHPDAPQATTTGWDPLAEAQEEARQVVLRMRHQFEQ
jgi:replication initiation protein RepC